MAPGLQGIYNLGNLAIANSSFIGNSASSDGGGIDNENTLTITNTTFNGNSASYWGGGLFNHGNSLAITNGTFSNNTATNDGGHLSGRGYGDDHHISLLQQYQLCRWGWSRWDLQYANREQQHLRQ